MPCLSVDSGGSPGGLEHAAVDVEQPAVIAAADTALGDDPVFERRAAMAAVPVKQPHALRSVPEQHKVLAQDPDGEGKIRELRG